MNKVLLPEPGRQPSIRGVKRKRGVSARPTAFPDLPFVVIDPNKRDLLYALGSNGKKLRYTQPQREKEIGKRRHERIRQNYLKSYISRNPEARSILQPPRRLDPPARDRLDNPGVDPPNPPAPEPPPIPIPIPPPPIPPKTTVDPLLFQIYLIHFFSGWTTKEDFYQKSLFRRLKLTVYCNAKRSEDRYIRKFKGTFGQGQDTADGKGTLVVIGDWDASNYTLPGQVVTKGRGFRYVFLFLFHFFISPRSIYPFLYFILFYLNF